jgi:predicted RND superfamily exporter protein
MDLYISHDKSKRLNIYLFGLFFYTSIRIKERVVNLMIKFGKGVVKHRVLILIVAFALLIPSGISFINTRINFDILSYLPSQIETMKGQDIMVDEFGTGALSFVILEDMKDQDIETLADDIEDLRVLRMSSGTEQSLIPHCQERQFRMRCTTHLTTRMQTVSSCSSPTVIQWVRMRQWKPSTRWIRW